MVEYDKVVKSNIRSEPNTPGGTTYYVQLPGAKVERAVCFRRSKTVPGMRCTNSAGRETWHDGTGACKFHGGSAGEHQLFKNGRASIVSKTMLSKTIENYLQQDRASLLDLTYELAAAKAIGHQLVENFPDDANADNYGIWLRRFNESIMALSNLVEKISRVETRNQLTAAEVLFIRATMVDMFMKYIPDPHDRERAVRELASRLGGDVQATMKPSEYKLLSV